MKRKTEHGEARPAWDSALLLVLLAGLLFASPLFDWVLSARPIWLTPFLLWSGFILVIYMVNRADGH